MNPNSPRNKMACTISPRCCIPSRIPARQVALPGRRSRSSAGGFVRLRATSQDNSVSTSSDTPTPESMEQERVKPAAEAAAAAAAAEESEEQDIAQALKELRKQDAPKPSLWEGLAEEIGLIEWPSLGKVLGTTLVVLGIILGSSFVLLSVNLLLAELSDAIFKAQ